jgi:hypothetical protein
MKVPDCEGNSLPGPFDPGYLHKCQLPKVNRTVAEAAVRPPRNFKLQLNCRIRPLSNTFRIADHLGLASKQ